MTNSWAIAGRRLSAGRRYHRRSVALLIGLGLASTNATAAEPDDSIETAASLGAWVLDEPVAADGGIGDGAHADRDVDIYSFAIDAAVALPVILRVSITPLSGGIDPFVRLFDDTGVELASNDDASPATPASGLGFYLLDHGPYFLGVSTASNPHYDPAVAGSGRPGTSGTYHLAASIESVVPPASSLEPNDSVSAPTAMGDASFEVLGEFIGDGIHGRLDVDVFALGLGGPARVDVAVRASGSAPQFDPVVRMRNCGDAILEKTWVDPCLLAASDDSPDGSYNAFASAAALAAQNVYILVSGAGNRRFDPAHAGSGEPGSAGYYDLSVTVTPLPPNSIGEPNDSIPMAHRLRVFTSDRPNVIELDGIIGDNTLSAVQGDRDFYEVTVADGPRLLTLEVSAADGSALDPVLRLYDIEGRLVASNDNVPGSTRTAITRPSPCAPVEPEAVSLYALVMGAGQRPPGDPMLPMPVDSPDDPAPQLPAHLIGDGPGSEGAYHLEITTSALPPCPPEPNDTLSDASDTGIVGEGVYACTRGLLGDGLCEDQQYHRPEEDADSFRLEVTQAPATLDVEIFQCGAGTLADEGYTAIVFDLAGREIGRAETELWYEPRRSLVIPRPGPYILSLGTYFSSGLDPTSPCFAEAVYSAIPYDVMITLRPVRGSSTGGFFTGYGTPGAATIPDGPVFVTVLDDSSAEIAVIDPSVGTESTRFPAPEPRLGGAEGLAYDGLLLYYVGLGRYPFLYRLDSASGAVLERAILSVGSGYFTDAALIAGELYLLDVRDQSIQVFDPVAARWLRTLPLRAQTGLSIGGGLAALSGPNRLFVADAFGSRSIYEVHPQTGTVAGAIPDVEPRPVAVGGHGESQLFVSDWRTLGITVLDRTGLPIGELDLPYSAGSIAGAAPSSPYPPVECLWSSKLTVPHSPAGTKLGRAIAVDGDTALVSAFGECVPTRPCGSVYPLRFDGSRWVVERPLSVSDRVAGDQFGAGIAITDDVAIIGTPYDRAACGDAYCRGSASIFRFDGTTWSFEQKLNMPDAAFPDHAGSAVAIDGTVAVVGGYFDACPTMSCGIVRTFRFNGTQWIPEEAISSPVAGSFDLQFQFGYSIAVSGERLLIGAPGEDCTAGSDCGAAYLYHYQAPNWVLRQKLTLSGAREYDRFGSAVAMDGDVAVIGVNGAFCPSGSVCGSAHVFRYNGVTWVRQQELTAPGRTRYDGFGASVAVRGDVAVVGAAQASCADGNACGAAHVFRFNGMSWVLARILASQSPGAGDTFGANVAIDGDTIAVSASGSDCETGPDCGAVHAFRSEATSWTERQEITLTDLPARDSFGGAVAIDGTSAVVGAPRSDCDTLLDCGLAYVFWRSGNHWLQDGKLTRSSSGEFDRFGSSVSIATGTVLVGVPYADCDGGVDCGTGTVFERDGNLWYEQQTLVPDPNEPGDLAGSSVLLAGGVAFLGAPGRRCDAGNGCGAAFGFRRDGPGWVQQQVLSSADALADDGFGDGLAAYGDHLVVGAPAVDCALGPDCGAAYVFRLDGTDWIEEQKLGAVDLKPGDRFGDAVGIGPGVILVGAPRTSCELGAECGAAYAFQFDGVSWSQLQKLTVGDVAAGGQFGHSLSVAGNLAVVGARPATCPPEGDCGSAHLFRYDGTSWVPAGRLTAIDLATGEEFGSSVAISEDTVVVGAPSDDCTPGATCGAVFVFDCIRNPLPGDFNNDRLVTIDDLGSLIECIRGPMSPLSSPACDAADLDGDGDADLFDFVEWVAALTGP